MPTPPKKSWADKFKLGPAKSVRISEQQLVTCKQLFPEESFLLMQPAMKGVNFHQWASGNRDDIRAKLRECGAILFRDFDLTGAEDVTRFSTLISGSTYVIGEETSPRTRIEGNVFTSTDYPSQEPIFPHNEASYMNVFPAILYFFCEVKPEHRGETPIGDLRKIQLKISQRTKQRFIEKKWLYKRNFGEGFGLTWEAAFQTSDRNEVERFCRANNIQWEWLDGNRLKTLQQREVLCKHPETGEEMWFNHATFYHVTSLSPETSAGMLRAFKDEDLPNNTYYGDGSPIEPEVLAELRAAYMDCLVMKPWEKGDLLLVDNLLTVHGREPYRGRRKILVSMAEPTTRNGSALRSSR